MKGWVIKFDDGEYKADKSCYASKDIRRAYIYLTKEMAEKVVNKYFPNNATIIEIEIKVV